MPPVRRRLLNLLTALSLLLFVAVAVLWLLNSGGSSSGEAALARAEGVLGGRLW